MESKSLIYLDHAAATPLDPEVLKAMLPYLQDNFSNPSGLYTSGRKARKAVEEARACIASYLQCKTQEIIFTGSGTESNNLAIQGVARAYSSQGNHIVTSSIEHHSVLHTFQALQKQGYEASIIRCDASGMIKTDELWENITDHTTLVSIIYANNEIGTIQPIQEIAQTLQEKFPHILFHTDACQVGSVLPLDVKKLQVDLMSVNGSKIYGPKGSAFLYVREGVRLEPILHGGGQERGLRSGTENVAGIVGLAKAVELAQDKRVQEAKRQKDLQKYFLQGLKKSISFRLNGHPTKRLPGNIHITLPNINGSALLMFLDQAGICASAGSSCASSSTEVSHVIQEIGYKPDENNAYVRFTLGKGTTKKEMNEAVVSLKQGVKKLTQA